MASPWLHGHALDTARAAFGGCLPGAAFGRAVGVPDGRRESSEISFVRLSSAEPARLQRESFSYRFPSQPACDTTRGLVLPPVTAGFHWDPRCTRAHAGSSLRMARHRAREHLGAVPHLAAVQRVILEAGAVRLTTCLGAHPSFEIATSCTRTRIPTARPIPTDHIIMYTLLLKIERLRAAGLR